MAFLKSTISAAAGIALLFGVGAAEEIKACPDDYPVRAVDYVESRLNDARGAKVQIVSEPYRVIADIEGYEGLPGWGVDVRVKSRLPGGSYGGYLPYTVIFVDGEAVALDDDASELTRV
ncbi:MAG: hypothetical protein U5J99_08595 [Parvularculaceae bacterium]|nr:hypothetical protein [Parvularculaceae bacterium]